ncbi:MurR/RpiR family transcriptional regulator [Aquibacillus saliphilus]|uniref:MurR/RpiR family transcriptional regulator n=1 Tax=Aquibacillus saliphilus TaxID=1909422 RepID=UPI001CF09E08|nr:MurR/RpiR family transcriptional regulator [Aquibacillus saliphilus]
MFTSEQIASFNELETQLYNYISENREKVAYMRIRELADKTHVSTATILRFCRKINCEGFSEFKVKLKLDIEQNETTVVKSGQHVLTEFFERSLTGSIDEKIQQAATIITKAETVIFIGIGSSGILAEYGARYFSSLGKFSMYIKDPLFPIRTHMLKSSATIALSVSGESNYSINHINQLKQEGSNIISITNSKHSTIATISNVNIPYYVTQERYQNSDITTQVPVVYILETLAREIHKLTNQNGS